MRKIHRLAPLREAGCLQGQRGALLLLGAPTTPRQSQAQRDHGAVPQDQGPSERAQAVPRTYRNTPYLSCDEKGGRLAGAPKCGIISASSLGAKAQASAGSTDPWGAICRMPPSLWPVPPPTIWHKGLLDRPCRRKPPPHPFATSVLLREPGSPSADLSEPQAHLTVMATWTSP